MSELEELRKKKLTQLQMMQQQGQPQQIEQQQKQQELESQIHMIIQKIMLPKARERLANIKVARPEFARQVELLLIQLAQSRNLPKRLDDETFKNMLLKITSKKRESTIKRI